MKLFQRKQPQPLAANPHSADTVAVPAIESVKTIVPEDQQFCACCHAVGARHVIRIGDFYLKSFLVYLCNTCMERRIEATCYHHFNQRKIPPDTLFRLEAISLAKERARGESA